MIKTTRRGVLLEGLCWLAEWDHVTQGDRRQLYDFLQLRTHSDIVLFPIGIVLACIYSYPTSHSITGSKRVIPRTFFVCYTPTGAYLIGYITHFVEDSV